MTTDSITKAAQALTEIGKLSTWLDDQALHRSSDRLMPGGRATVALAYVASPRAWAENIDADELYHLANCTRFDHTSHVGPDGRRVPGCRYAEAASDDDGDGPILQTLLFWSEAWRLEHGYEMERRQDGSLKCNIGTESNFLRGSLEWAWANEPHWDDFVQDLEDAKTKLENLLLQGIRSERGVPCMYDECKGKRLVRKMVPARDKDGNKIWRLTNWHCPRCHREWDEDRYKSSIAAAAWAAQSEDIDGEVWCSAKYAARQLGRSESCIRAWITRHGWTQVCMVRGRRTGFIRLADVEEHAAQAKRRGRAA